MKAIEPLSAALPLRLTTRSGGATRHTENIFLLRTLINLCIFIHIECIKMRVADVIKSLLKAGVLMAALAGSAFAAQETYVVGAGGTYRPFEFENSQKQLEGFDIDIIKAIAKAENFNVKLVNTPWEGIFATLGSGDRDIIISGITITDKRKQMVDFSKPYFPAEQSIVVPADSKVTSLAALKDEKVGVVNSSTGDIVVSDTLGKNNTAIKRFDNTPLMLQELFEDGVSAAVGDVGVVKYYIKQHPEKQFKLVPDAKFERQYFGIAVAKGNDELRDKINAGLAKIVADGTYAKIYKAWFDDNVPTLPAQ
ncbi:Glutamine ABC transporter, periplasmic glutamine-binding protein (TC 3.A.1.3.2) [Cronobacter dublinensis 582]|nr:Glutamine ABC transporter, periplasmic glutamine-binding protein (TC 3.A.1.3.2) [Cronobacter dublinensis 582]